jgi:fumarate reductase flavoprotein subunit
VIERPLLQSAVTITDPGPNMTKPTRGKISKRQFLSAMTVAAGALQLPRATAAADKPYDIIVVGGGNAGLPLAFFAAERGGRVLIVDAGSALGGTLFLSSGQMSAAGTKLQKAKGIDDTPQLHFDDIMRISKGTADKVLVKLAVENAAPAFDWLTDNGFVVGDKHPVTGTTHDPYSRARYAWAKKGGGVAILDVLEKKLKPHIDSGRVKVLLNSEVTELTQDTSGAVTGVKVRDDKGAVAAYAARNVALTCGGYTYDPALYAKLDGAPMYTNMTAPTSLGAGIKLGTSVGGYVRGGQNHTPLFGAVLVDRDVPTQIRAMVRHFPGDRPPWEIIVGADGKRFLQEDVLSHDVYEQALKAQPGERCWVVFDDAIFAKAPKLVTGGFAGPWTPEDTRNAFETGVTFFSKADTIETLAKKAGVDKAGLVATVTAYNKAQASGQDAWGRKHMPLPIAKPPYYALELHSWNLTSYGGLAVDGDLRVVRQDNTVVNNLYAAGELLGMGQMMGRSVCGGMSVTPALALGRLLGNTIIKV